MNKKLLQIPKFRSESEEADWWASPAGRAYVKQKSAMSKGIIDRSSKSGEFVPQKYAAETQSKRTKTGGSRLVARLNKKSSVQIAIRLPETDLAQARKIAERKGIGYQTLLKMLVREGLVRESRRA